MLVAPFAVVEEVVLVVVEVDAVPPGCAVTTVDVAAGHLVASALTHVTSPEVANASPIPVALSAGTLATAWPFCESKLVIWPPYCWMSVLAVVAVVPGLKVM